MGAAKKNYQLSLLHPFLSLKELAAFCLVRLQATTPLYGKFAQYFIRGIEIEEKEEALNKIQAFRFVFVAKKENRVVGSVRLTKYLRDNPMIQGYWLEELYVRVRYRCAGIGEKLAEAVIKKAREEKADRLCLLVDKDNRAAIKLYRQLGFEEDSAFVCGSIRVQKKFYLAIEK
jgi:ribosomal protein S18 acetylase RimI-like enzyme